MYTASPPPPALARYVECFWQVDAPAAAMPDHSGIDRVLPDGSINLMFNFGAPHRLFDPVDHSRFTLSHRAWVSGLRDDAIFIGPTDGTHMAGVRFKPGGLFPFLGIPASEFSHRVVEMDAVWGNEGALMAERLAEAGGARRRFALLAHWLLDRRARGPGADRRVSVAVAELCVEPTLRVSDIVARLGVSARHLNRLFHEQVGLGPKRLVRVLRFQVAIREIGLGPWQRSWADLALDCAYYDQAHFNREFRELSGLTPGDYVSRTRPLENFVEV